MEREQRARLVAGLASWMTQQRHRCARTAEARAASVAARLRELERADVTAVLVRGTYGGRGATEQRAHAEPGWATVCRKLTEHR